MTLIYEIRVITKKVVDFNVENCCKNEPYTTKMA